MRRRDRIHQNFKRALQHRNAAMQLVDIVVHKFKINTCWEDYYRFGFYRQDLSWDERSFYVGYFGSRFWPWDGNSLKFDRLFQLKSLQKAILLGHGISTPSLLAKVGTQYAINTPKKLRNAMSEFNEPFVTKFDGGGSGVGIYCLQPEGGRFHCKGEEVDSDWVWQKYASVIDRGFIIETLAVNHPDLHCVYPDSLNTVRLTTVKTADGLWHVLLPFVKFGRSGSQVDNMSAGGLFARIDDSGRIGTVYCAKTSDKFECHPDTNAPITGIKIPYFEEAKKLALDASRAFGFMSTVAWDVGITPDGPVIIEGNPFWDPQGVQDDLGPFLTPAVAAGLPPRSWWTPWDRTQLFPNYMSYADGGWRQRWLAVRRERMNEKLRPGMSSDAD